MMKRFVAFVFAAIAFSGVFAAGRQKVACIGDSITYGFLIEDREHCSYPAQLQVLLGDGYEVVNFGKSGATLLNRGHRPYCLQEEYAAALAFCPDIAVIHLGINDTDPRNWPNYNGEFIGDYLGLINALKEVNPDVRIIIARLTPLSASHYRFKSGTRDWRLQIQKAIEDVAAASGAELIDFDAPLRDRQNLLPDGIHPDAEGASILAKTVYGGITGDYGGIKLPEIYQSGMVLQRDRPLNISGTADSGSRITLTLDGRKYHALTDNRGCWSVRTAPLAAGTGYEMTVTDRKNTIRLTGIMAGEVWVASGQSNMAFRLRDAKGGKESAAESSDPLLRVYDMQPIAYTDNVQWPDSVVAAVNSLNYFKHAEWHAVSPENAGAFSAVAYYFAKELRDSLDVPVGIICNAVGGATTESWIDVNFLERDIPEILLNWLTNDYVQKWAQGRAVKNMGGAERAGRHPYGPGYLFGAGIRPLEGFAVAGTIWYQGESNAHNIEVHERLFPLVVESWRKNFNDADMPFYFVQLSSIDRPSWPQFRDSQRRLAASLRNTGMAVSSDLGDSLDVHPKDKRPIGERLARQALKRTYGHTAVPADGPRPVRAFVSKGKVSILMSDGQGMHTCDGAEPSTFEVAEFDGLYKPASVKISDGVIVVSSPEVKNPRFVRYGWQPYTRANLVNSANLPASTFKMEAADEEKDCDIKIGNQ